MGVSYTPPPPTSHEASSLNLLIHVRHVWLPKRTAVSPDSQSVSVLLIVLLLEAWQVLGSQQVQS